MSKINLLEFIDVYDSTIKYYLSIKDCKIIEEYDYFKLPDCNKENCILITIYGENERINVINKYLEEMNNNILLRDFNENYKDYQKHGYVDYVTAFHFFAENNKKWEDFIFYQRKFIEDEATKFCIDICNNYNLKYYKYDKYKGLTADEVFKKLLEDNYSIIHDEERKKYYENKIANKNTQ